MVALLPTPASRVQPLQSTTRLKIHRRSFRHPTEEPNVHIGLTHDELQSEIERRMFQLDEAQEEAEHLGPYGDLLRMIAVTAYQRAADLIALNNDRLAAQLTAAGITLPK